MWPSARMSLLLAIGMGGMTGVASGWPGIVGRLEALRVASAEPVETVRVITASADGRLRNPASFIVVRTGGAEKATEDGVRISMPFVPEQTGGRAADDGPSGRLIAVPDNARAGDPAYASVDEEEEEWYTDEGGPTVYGPHGIIFADGIELGYSWLRQHPAPHGRHRQTEREGVPEFGANDLHRSAQLQFAEAAQPRLDGLDAGFRRAQLEFHRSTLTPGVPRQSDGLRHERSPSGARPRPRR